MSDIFPRWIVVVYHRTNDGMVDVEHTIEELEELAVLVERGPNWFTIDRIEIKLIADESYPGLTVEQSEDL